MVLLIVQFVINILVAIQMYKIIEDKGYGFSSTRTIGVIVCVLFGVLGCLYVAALPDSVLQDQNRRILEALEEKK